MIRVQRIFGGIFKRRERRGAWGEGTLRCRLRACNTVPGDGRKRYAGRNSQKRRGSADSGSPRLFVWNRYICRKSEGTMQAYTYVERGRFELTEREKPRLRDSRDAIVRVTLASICSSDLHIRHGSVPRAVPGIVVGPMSRR